MDALVRQGKVRYIGLSNYPAWKIMKLRGIADLNGLTKFISGQFLYNLLKRDIEREIMPACEDVGMGILCWSPLSGGMLSGKYFSQEQPPDGSRFDSRKNVVKDKYTVWQEKSNNLIRELINISSKCEKSPSELALAWLLKKEEVSSVLMGVKNVNQLNNNLGASDWNLPDEYWTKLDSLSKIDLGYPNDIYQSTTKDWYNSIYK